MIFSAEGTGSCGRFLDDLKRESNRPKLENNERTMATVDLSQWALPTSRLYRGRFAHMVEIPDHIIILTTAAV